MIIDRTRSLLATSVLSVSIALSSAMVGCSSSSDETPAPLPHDDDASRPSTDTTSPGPGGSGPAGKTDPDGGAGKDGGDSKDGGDAATTAACLDDSAPAVQPACPGGGVCQTACDNYAADYKKGLSAEIRKCLTAPICMASTAACADKALAKACADPTATAFCTPMVNGCKGSNPADTITQASCEALARGLTATGRDVLKNCFENEALCGDCLARLK